MRPPLPSSRRWSSAARGSRARPRCSSASSERATSTSRSRLSTRALAAEDPRAFLRLHKPPVIFDEVQQAPHLLSYIQELIDGRRDLNGQYILGGSQNLLLLQHVSESLAGRAAILKLLPLSLREWCGEPGRPLPWQGPAAAACAELHSRPEDLWQLLFRGL